MLKERVITACILVVLLAVELLELPFAGFVFVMSLIFVIAAWEWSNMAGLLLSWQRYAYTGFFALLFAALFQLGVYQQPDILFAILLLSLCGWLLAFGAVWRYPEGNSWNQPAFLVPAGLWLLVPAWLGLLRLQPLVAHSGLIWLVLAVIAAADIGAYFSGKKFGRHKLAAHVSPGKTWEGFWGGALANVILAIIISLFLDLKATQFIGFVLAIFFVSLSSVLGDLFESMVKRERGIKDSSHLLPGHGGVLDRIDGWTAAVPIFTLLHFVCVH